MRFRRSTLCARAQGLVISMDKVLASSEARKTTTPTEIEGKRLRKPVQSVLQGSKPQFENVLALDHI